MEQEKDSIDDRLQQVSRQWRSQRYTGPAPDFEPTPRSPQLGWAGAAVAAAVLVIAIWPSQPDWPEQLRPLLRGSPFQAAAPTPPAQGVAFRLPVKPSRGSCFSQIPSQNRNCEPPAG